MEEQEERTDEFQVMRQWEEMIATQGWRLRLTPILIERKQAMERHFRNPSNERKSKIPDDYIRGQLDVIELILEHPQLLIDTTRAAQAEEKFAKDREIRYSQQASLGYGLGGGITADVEDELV